MPIDTPSPRDRRGRPPIAGWLGLLIAASTIVVRAMAGDGSRARTGDDPAAIEFFEKSVRPLLASRCQGCHGPDKQKGGLRLDARSAVLAGGNTGPAIVPGDPGNSLLIGAINYGEDHQMPPKSKLPDGEIATLTRWVEIGAPWGVETAPAAADAGKPGSATASGGTVDIGALMRERARHWSFQPLRRPDPPATPDPEGWARNPIDRFILAGLQQRGLNHAPGAARRTLIRRLSFDLIGLPPTPAEVQAFLDDRSPDAYERLVDRLLASPRYGERWARHWLDLVRYAETSGHEFDYDILGAHRYRDYVIRAFNAGIPFDEFAVEHLAGDLLDHPRRHPALGFNESIIATGFLLLGEGTHSPVDVREEEVRRIDNQIDVISKTFLGLTVACARCHDHKFDPITARDYYALAGFLRSSRYQQAFIDPPDRIGGPIRRLEGIRRSIVDLLSEARDDLGPTLRGPLDRVLGRSVDPDRADGGRSRDRAARPEAVFEDFDRDGFDGWFVAGDAFGAGPTRAGELRLDLAGGPARLERIGAGQAHSGRVSGRLRGVLRSRTFTIRSRYIRYRVAGRGGTINVVVDGFEKIRDPIYGGLTTTVDVGDRFRWITQDVGMWIGQTAYLELADGAVPDYNGGATRLHDGLGELAVDEIRMSDRPEEESDADRAGSASVDLGPIVAALRTTRPGLAAAIEEQLDRYRSTEAAIPDPTLALAIADGTGMDERVLIRGSHKNPGEPVPRRFLDVLGGDGMATASAGSGRLELARRLVDPRANPLTPRVLVNRLWEHHIGEGIVKSTDDFGAMGQKPTHPELLDWLASQLVERDWSIKALQRLIVTSSTYRMSSRPDAEADPVDPGNVLLHRMNVRRLEAEAIRDALLAASGRLSERMYGPGVPVHLTGFMDGRGRPSHSGPLDGDGRRSVYLAVRRNFLNPMFLAFDTPAPFSTMGRRNVSNVPAQALILLNDPLVILEARELADRILSAPLATDRDRVDALFSAVFARRPAGEEARDCLAFLRGDAPAAPAGGPDRSRAWADLAHVLFNMKEFIFID